MAAAKSEVLQSLYKNLSSLSCPYLSTSEDNVESLKDLLTDADLRYDFLNWLFTRLDIQLAKSLKKLPDDLKCAPFSKIFASLGLYHKKNILPKGSTECQINILLLLMSICCTNETLQNSIERDVKFEVEANWDCSDFKHCNGLIPQIIKKEILKVKNAEEKERKIVDVERHLLNLEEEHNSIVLNMQKVPEINLATNSSLQQFHGCINELSKNLQMYKKIHEINFDPVLTNSSTNSALFKNFNLDSLFSELSQTKTMVDDLEKTSNRSSEIGFAFKSLQTFAQENNVI